MESPDPEEMGKVLAIVLGAGTSGAVSGFVRGLAPQVSAEIAGGGAGLLIYLFGDRVEPKGYLKAYGVGLMAGSLKGLIERAIPAVTGGGAAPSGTGGSGGSDALAAAKANYGWT